VGRPGRKTRQKARETWNFLDVSAQSW